MSERLTPAGCEACEARAEALRVADRRRLSDAMRVRAAEADTAAARHALVEAETGTRVVVVVWAVGVLGVVVADVGGAVFDGSGMAMVVSMAVVSVLLGGVRGLRAVGRAWGR